MKLIGQNGEQNGRVVDVGALGITLGREQDNDVVLTEGLLSRYHARVAQQDGVWYLHDLDSTNGVYLNGKKIDKSSTLSLHDRIRIGSSDWVFTDDSGSLPGGAPRGAAAPSSVSSDGGKKDEASDGSGDARKKRLAILGVVFVLMLLVVGMLAVLVGGEKPAVVDNGPATPAGDQQLHVVYEKFKMDSNGIFRYALTVDGPLLRVQVDDLRNRRHIEEQAELTEEFLKSFAESCLDEGFLRLAVPASFASETRVDETRLAVWQGRKGNSVTIVNDVVPPQLERVMDAVEVAVEELLGVGSVPLTREEIMNRAQEKFAFAERAYVERDVKADNLFRSLNAYRFVTEYLAGFEERPEFYAIAVRREREVDAELTDQLEQLQYAARMQVRVDELEKARGIYEEIVNRVPDPKNAIVQNARDNIYKIARRLEAQKKAKKNR